MNKFIFDPLTEEPTLSATNRAKRADQTGAVASIGKKKPEEEKAGVTKGSSGEKTSDNTSVDTGQKKKVCFFCKGSEHLTPPTLYQDSDDWNVRVFSNKYPLMDDHEVIVHSPHDELDIEDFDADQTARIIRAYLDRVIHYGKQEKEVYIFNNRGGKAGASLLHPHSQLVASKGFPGYIEKEKESALHYYNEYDSCYWCDEIAREIEYGKRIVIESSHFIVYVPSACRWSYELRLAPKRHLPNMQFINEQEINDLAKVLKDSLLSYDTLFNRPDRNFWIHTMRYEPYHWHMGFIPHIKVFGALELGAGIWVSDKAVPEDAAQQLKETLS